MLKDFSKEEFDVFIQAGQSNSAGGGEGDAVRPFMTDPDVYYLNNDFTICLAFEQVYANTIFSNFSLAFCRKYKEDGKLQNGRKLLIVRAAVAATGFSDKRWGLNDDLYLRMVEMTKTAIELNTGNRLKALLWHQGETDAQMGTDRGTHYKNLSALVASVRKTFDRDLPFIASDFVQQWREYGDTDSTPISQAMKDVCKDMGRAFFVCTDGLQSNDQRLGNGDMIHFCREAQYQLGARYYEAFLKLH